MYPCQKGLDLPLSGHFQGRSEICQRLEHEGPFVHSRMRDTQPGLVDLGVPEEEKVEIERPWPLRRNALAYPAELPLEVEQDSEQFARSELGLERNDTVEEARLIDVADWCGIDEPRDGSDANSGRCGERVDRSAERGFAVAEVGAERDIGRCHGARVRSGLPLRRFLIVLIAALCGSGIAAAATSPAWWSHDVGADQVAPPGPGVPIAIVDTGVDPSQPLFSGRANTTFLNDQSVSGRDEFHGTAVASVALSIYPQAALESWDASPTSQIVDLSAAEGIVTAALHCPAVINLSFGGASFDQALEDAVVYAQHRGCLVVAAAGNGGLSGSPPVYPAGYTHVLTVGANDQNDQVAMFSTVAPGIDLSAPGVSIDGSVPLSHDPSGTSTGLAGTSFAAPIVSAAAAWIWTMRPALDASQIFALLRGTARDIATPGFDLQSGFGIVNIPAALAAPVPARDPQEPNDDIDEVKPGALFSDGEPLLTSSVRPSNGISGSLDQAEDQHDLYRVWVPPNRVLRARVISGGTAAARIWGPETVSVAEPLAQRRRDLIGPLIRGGARGGIAYVEVLLTGASPSSRYILSVTASKR